tara:strand:- start:13254 stop:14270 length:1017 start_codon:yes stop_codon:yes gene_type:complete
LLAATPAFADEELNLGNMSAAELEQLSARIVAEQEARRARLAEIDEQMAALNAERASLLGTSRPQAATENSEAPDTESEPTGDAPAETDQTGEPVTVTSPPPDGDNNSETDQQGPVEDSNGEVDADDSNGTTNNGDSEGEGLSLSSLGFGGGIALTHNLSGTRVADLHTYRQDDDELYVQITESEEQSVRFIAETHYLFEDVSLNDNWDNEGNIVWTEWLSDLAICGLFSLKFGDDTASRRGCGPFIAGFASEDTLIEEFGIGHMVSFGIGTGDDEKAFNLGYGIMFDPDSETLDTRLLQPGTMYVLPEFADAVENDALSLVTKEETMGFFVVFSANL